MEDELNNPFGIQSILSNAVDKMRQESFKTSSQLSLGEIILKLEVIKNKKLPVIFDIKKYHPTGIDSWRGSYCELALGYDSKGKPMSLDKFLELLKNTIGKTFTGWKGGDFLMGKTTPVWVANEGECAGIRKDGYKDTAVMDILEDKKAVIIKTEAIEY